MADPVAVLEALSYIYPHAASPALKNVSLEVARGEFLGIVGPTGAGKTTLCLTFNGIVPQFYGGRFFGRMQVAGFDTVETPISRLARHVGMVFEDPESQLTATSVENEVAFPLENLCVPPPEIRERIRWALEAVGLAGLEARHPATLSGGQKQRLAVAAALALRPDLLVLDEPTSQLDPAGVEELFAILRALHRLEGVTVVMVSHAAEALAEHADRIALLVAGELETVGTPEAIFKQSERLEAHGVRVPQVTRTWELLREAGLPVGELPVSLGSALDAAQQLRPQLAPLSASTPLPGAGYTEGVAVPLVAVQGLHHVYENGVAALQGVDLEVGPGEYLLIAGPNGAGKSTLVKHLVGLLRPTRGRVLVGGQETEALSTSALARRVGYVSQNPDRQLFTATVEEEVGFALRNLGHPPGEVEARTVESLTAMGLLDRRQSHPLALPRGDRARLVIAAVLAQDPQILIFDEPTTGQDVRGARAILEITRTLHAAGKTVIVVTHHLSLMPGYARRAVLLAEGTLRLDAPLRQAYHEVELLRRSDLEPPQAVLLARTLCPGRLLVTPEEVAACAAGRWRGGRG
ncbi:MAG: ABC transporter ATP-binding protein [Anaerolineales bacterium]